MSTNGKLTQKPDWFARNLRGAILLSAIGVGSALLALNVFSWALGRLFQGAPPAQIVDESGGDPLQMIALLALMLVALLVPVLIGAILLYRLGSPRHFGRPAAVRWAGFGGTFGLLAAALGVLAGAQELEPIVETLAYGGLLAVSYCLAFVWTMPRE